jgi:ubiquinone/menaquinone biosynthesis C-methylase UbiE
MMERIQNHVDPEKNTEAVLRYYKAAEKGYWGYLGGRCHYGYTPENYKGKFDMHEAQIEMERKLGQTLKLPIESKVLDAGCGWSPVARTLTQEFGYDVIGVDLIEKRLRGGKQLSEKLNMSHMDLVNGNYHNLPFADASFDGVYTMETIVHAHSLDKVLSEFYRILKPRGKVVLFEYSIPDLNKVPKIPRMLAERVIKNTGMASLPRMIHESWPNILKDAGFENAKAVDISKNVYPSWFYLWKFSIKNTLEEFGQGHISVDSIPGSMWIWPARKCLGYNICQATKPLFDH